MLDIEKIRQLVNMMVVNDLVELSLRDGDVEVSLRRPNSHPAGPAPFVALPAVAAGSSTNGPTGERNAEAPAAAEPEVETVEIKSPMVGTFYTAPDPESPPFVQPGAHVHPGTVVCIVEAMKVFNEIKAEVEGVIDRVLAKGGQAVEFGQPLFRVRSA